VLAYKNDKFSSKNISHCGISSGQDQDQCTALEGDATKKEEKSQNKRRYHKYFEIIKDHAKTKRDF